MNKKRILELAEYIENSGTYDQAFYFHSCGTPGCIAGHAAALFKPENNSPYYIHYSEIGKKILGLNLVDSVELFDPEPYKDELDEFNFYREPTAKDAAAVLRNLADTGIVNWR